MTYNSHQRRNSEVPFVKSYSNPNQDLKEELRNESPIQSSSAPSTASTEQPVQYFPPVMSMSHEQVVMPTFDQTMERSMSLPSIGPQSRPHSGNILEDSINNNNISNDFNNESQVWERTGMQEKNRSSSTRRDSQVPFAENQIALDERCNERILALKNSQEFIPSDVGNK
jgi:hypothetical protein